MRRNQERDLCILNSFSDDLKQYWKWKALKWEKIRFEITHTRKLRGYTPDPTDESDEETLRRTLLGDDDYRDLIERLAVELEETKKIYEFLEIELTEEIQQIKFDVALIDNEILEPVIDDIDWLIPVCKAYSYPLRHFRAAIKHPRQWLREYFSE